MSLVSSVACEDIQSQRHKNDEVDKPELNSSIRLEATEEDGSFLLV